MWLRIAHFLGLTNLTDQQVELYEGIREEYEQEAKEELAVGLGLQQLLLLTLAAIIVGLSVTVGINMFGENTAEAEQDALIQDVLTLASRAQGWYRKPDSMGGGGLSFGGITLKDLKFDSTNVNGSYILRDASTMSVTITGTSVEDFNRDGLPLTVTVTVYADSVSKVTIQK